MFKYLVMVMRTSEFQPSLVEAHQAFLQDLRKSNHLELSGPFADKAGGAYLIKAVNLEEAKKLAFSDPLHTSSSSAVTVYEWNVK